MRRRDFWHQVDWQAWDVIVSPLTILLRFIIGAILATGLGLWVQLPFPLNIILVLGVSTMAAVWGDRFILGFMSLLRYFR